MSWAILNSYGIVCQDVPLTARRWIKLDGKTIFFFLYLNTFKKADRALNHPHFPQLVRSEVMFHSEWMAIPAICKCVEVFWIREQRCAEHRKGVCHLQALAGCPPLRCVCGVMFWMPFHLLQCAPQVKWGHKRHKGFGSEHILLRWSFSSPTHGREYVRIVYIMVYVWHAETQMPL